MYKTDDLLDAVFEVLGRNGLLEPPAPPPPRPVQAAARAPLRGRVFLSEYEIRGRLTAGARELRIPKGAIVSPLAQDWLSLKGIRVVEE